MITDAVGLVAFEAVIGCYCLIWGVGSKRIYDQARLTRPVVLRLMSVSRLEAPAAAALVGGVAYLSGGIAAILLAATLFGTDWGALLAIPEQLLPLTIAGLIAELSATALLTNLAVRSLFSAHVEAGSEVARIPWLRATLRSPVPLVVMGIIASATVEEILFRGVLLTILLRRFGTNPGTAIGVSAAAFTIQQVCQVSNRHQAAIIGLTCVAIAVVGGLLVVLTGSVVAGTMCHASSVIFYVRGARRR